ncbi:hypothetical protein AGR4C_Lc90031 [Agrobacterium tumefaciens str. Kerr 14]|uniref:Uncharacterized protein n=1 Tax=Agrobacterium tumefaciens str. Kerr 14 TaxID=1183424 RepID=A0A1S7S649_AGRTU|nr:hypothetical protein AGR4C_Lc90031 [Agrobacterium tumefaciens str. Kerr 14]
MSHGWRGVKLMNFKTLEHMSEGAEIYSMLWQHNRRPILVCHSKSITKLDCYRMDFRTCPFSAFKISRMPSVPRRPWSMLTLRSKRVKSSR